MDLLFTCCCGSYSVDWTGGDPSARSSSIQALATSSWTSSGWTLFSLAFCYEIKTRFRLRIFKTSSNNYMIFLFTARLAAIVLADGGNANVHRWPVPVRALTLFLKCGLIDKLWRTEFFQRSSFALKYGNLSLFDKEKESHKVIESRDSPIKKIKKSEILSLC